MSLTVGRGPFGAESAGRFNFTTPAHVVYVEEFPRRVRARRDDAIVVDSDRVKLVHESGALPRYSFAREDVHCEADSDPAVADHVTIPWDSVDAWFEEDEQVFVHPRDPYHRIDTFSTSRLVSVALDGVELARSSRARVLYETSLPPRYYLPNDDVDLDLLVPSSTVTQCAYKGSARHWSARVGAQVVPDVAWTYDDDVRREAESVRGRIAFYNERVDLAVDGVRQDRPATPWSR